MGGMTHCCVICAICSDLCAYDYISFSSLCTEHLASPPRYDCAWPGDVPQAHCLTTYAPDLSFLPARPQGPQALGGRACDSLKQAEAAPWAFLPASIMDSGIGILCSSGFSAFVPTQYASEKTTWATTLPQWPHHFSQPCHAAVV